MDDSTTAIAVHRCRFVDFAPSPISALAFPPLPLPSVVKNKKSTTPLPFGTLAVGHANGNIDLCEWTASEHPYQSPQAWVVRKTLAGPFPSKVDSLAFAIRQSQNLASDDVPLLHDLRLFSSGGGSDLVEWDLRRRCVRRTIGSQGGSIWSMAVNPASTLLALGCEDGSVRLVSLLNDTLTLHRRFDRVKCRLLSIAWGPPTPQGTHLSVSNGGEESSGADDDDSDREWVDSWIVAGGSDSSLRKLDVSTGRVLERMSMDKARGERTLVWAVGVLGDGTIISGDSLGMVKFWDSRTCTQLHSFQGHKADVLCLAVGPDGFAVYTSGVDQKISQFSLVKSNGLKGGSTADSRTSVRWVHSSARRMHSHDVRALAIWPPYTALPPLHKRNFPVDISPILASGGLDMSIVLTPAALPNSTVVKVTNPLCTSADPTFEVSYHRRLAYTCGPCFTSVVGLARRARLLTLMRDTVLTLWKILPREPVVDASEIWTQDPIAPQEAGWKKVLDMELNVHTNLIATAISDDGQWLVTSDLYEAKLFRLTKANDAEIRPRRVRNFTSILQAYAPSIMSTGGSAFCFTPDSSKLIMAIAMSAYLFLIDLGDQDHDPTVIRTFDHHRSQNGVRNRATKTRKIDGAFENSNSSDTSATVNVLRVAVSADGQWIASSDDHARTHVFNLDSIQHHCTLPSFPHPAHVLAFDPSHSNLLVMGFANDMVQVFDVETRQFPSWSTALSDLLTKRLTHAHDPIMGVSFNPADAAANSPTQALLWGSSWICNVKLDGSFNSSSRKKRRHGNRKHSLADPSIIPTADEENVDKRSTQESQDLKVITHFRPNLYVDFIAAGELVVVERPLVDVLATLPPAYFKHKYGAS